ncbi:MAG TPA: D-alanine--D-alanine ligase [Burkholderiales bacterium]|nr:D-alanine--D-alanine ligase [Burkholderiales bacterium]
MLGGRSAEREISLKSGTAVLAGLRARGVDAHAFDPRDRALEELRSERFSRVFIALHGRYGEDGTVQGALELMGIPYTGSGVLGSALAMDKLRSKMLWQAAGIGCAPHVCAEAGSPPDFAAVIAALGLPLMVKPANEGSSIGMSKVVRAEELAPAFALAARYDRVILIEQFIEGVELTAGILGDETLPLIRLETPRVFYDYQAKYFADDTRYLCPCGLAPELERAIQARALEAFRLLGCGGWGRVDLILGNDGVPRFLEVNTAPGMTDHSLVPMAARARGMSFEDLVVRILELAHVGQA